MAFAWFTSLNKVQVIKQPEIVRVPTAIITPAGVHKTTYNYNVRAGIESGGINITHSNDKATTTEPKTQIGAIKDLLSKHPDTKLYQVLTPMLGGA